VKAALIVAAVLVVLAASGRDGRQDTIRGGPGLDRAQVDRGVDRVSGVEKIVP